MTDLPPGWAEVTFGDLVLSMKNGAFVSRPGIEPDGVPILRVSAVRSLALDLADVRYTGLSKELLEGKKAIIEPGDLLFVRLNGNADYVGVCAAVPSGAKLTAYSDKQIRVKVNHNLIDPYFAAFMFASPKVRADVRARVRTTAGQASIAGSDIRKISIPLPPLSEQRRIVVALESNFSLLDAAIASLENSQARASALLRRVLADLVTPSDGDRWDETSIGEIATTVRNGMYVSRPGVEPNGVPILRIGAVRSLELNTSDLRYSAKSEFEVANEGYLLNQGDLLFTRYNGNPEYVGACAVVPEGIGPLTYPDKLIRVTIDDAKAYPEYVAMACSYGPSREKIRSSVKTTAGQAGISGRELKAIPLFLPSLNEQAERLQMFTDQRQVVRRLTRALTVTRERAEHLRKSLLMEAFAGRLVSQDPRDELASALLDQTNDRRTISTSGRGSTSVRSNRQETFIGTPVQETLL